jgi:signal-transduction protein with cAMP-binding, CBS, and nucleotidyltransferase domain
MALIDTQLTKLRDLLDRMRYVSEGEMVLAAHTNLFREYVLTALDALKELYAFYKGKFGTTLPLVEAMIELVENRIGFLPVVKYGDVVATRDHNIIIECLKAIEIALIEIDKSIFIGDLRLLYERLHDIYRQTG